MRSFLIGIKKPYCYSLERESLGFSCLALLDLFTVSKQSSTTALPSLEVICLGCFDSLWGANRKTND